MKDTATHRKRTKSDSDKTGDHKDGHHASTTSGKGSHAGSKHGGHGGSQHAAHGSHHGHHGKGDHGHHGKGDHGHHGKGDHGHHGKGDHGHHGKGDHGHHKGDHGHHKGGHHGHHGHHDDHHGHHDDHHHSASSHQYRPRRDTVLSRGGHSVHHGSDRRSVGSNDGMSEGPRVHYENTYKMTPDDKFHEGKVRDIIRAVFKENITEKKYEPSVCGAKCKLISEIIKERVKKLNMHRFKIIAMATIGQISEQSMLVTSRCLWNHNFDNSVSVTYQEGDILAVGVVFAVYAE